jgi:hypothetical protein
MQHEGGPSGNGGRFGARATRSMQHGRSRAAAVDQAIQQVADASGGLVTVGPKIELTSCSWWAGGTDLTGAGNTGAGELLAAHYQTH